MDVDIISYKIRSFRCKLIRNIVKYSILEQNCVNCVSDDESPHKGDDLTGPEAWLDIYK